MKFPEGEEAAPPGRGLSVKERGYAARRTTIWWSTGSGLLWILRKVRREETKKCAPYAWRTEGHRSVTLEKCLLKNFKERTRRQKKVVNIFHPLYAKSGWDLSRITPCDRRGEDEKARQRRAEYLTSTQLS